MCDQGGVCLAIPIIEITRSTEANFLAYNRQAEDLDSDWLMQPVNEAEYDSETQFCVDTQTGAALDDKSFYSHYVTKRKKTKGLKRGKKQGDDNNDDPTKLSVAPHPHVPKRAPLTVPHPSPNIMATGPKPANGTQGPITLGVDHLDLPGMPAPPKGSLNNAATRRIACGALPPGMRGPQKPAIIMELPKADNQQQQQQQPQEQQDPAASPPPALSVGTAPVHVNPNSPTLDIDAVSPPSYEQASQHLTKKPLKASFSSRHNTPTPPRSTTPTSAAPSSPPASPADDPAADPAS